ncbi:hypothetical protein BDK51DRAFT_40848 [Blyttiomyces helicus]|uniref:Uncharacterized protein n=1 Tax=Blyttiomyces helicus TaxID=388810 RepID=A0A4P9WB45_9FUNG|nr:hypothetical protein BDK51DRAFT_40848 [Blyttiomyces helicus]|eukprot:RKO89841.1 hypothetical protein BDK51DRAFT_40848 [Blyttiomyces helicus]
MDSKIGVRTQEPGWSSRKDHEEAEGHLTRPNNIMNKKHHILRFIAAAHRLPRWIQRSAKVGKAGHSCAPWLGDVSPRYWESPAVHDHRMSFIEFLFFVRKGLTTKLPRRRSSINVSESGSLDPERARPALGSFARADDDTVPSDRASAEEQRRVDLVEEPPSAESEIRAGGEREKADTLLGTGGQHREPPHPPPPPIGSRATHLLTFYRSRCGSGQLFGSGMNPSLPLRGSSATIASRLSPPEGTSVQGSSRPAFGADAMTTTFTSLVSTTDQNSKTILVGQDDPGSVGLSTPKFGPVPRIEHFIIPVAPARLFQMLAS